MGSPTILMCENFPSVNEATSHSSALPIRFEVSTTKLGKSPSNDSNVMMYLKLKSPCVCFCTSKSEMPPMENSRAFFNATLSASQEIGRVDKVPSFIVNDPPLDLLLYPVVIIWRLKETA